MLDHSRVSVSLLTTTSARVVSCETRDLPLEQRHQRASARQTLVPVRLAVDFTSSTLPFSICHAWSTTVLSSICWSLFASSGALDGVVSGLARSMVDSPRESTKELGYMAHISLPEQSGESSFGSVHSSYRPVVIRCSSTPCADCAELC